MCLCSIDFNVKLFFSLANLFTFYPTELGEQREKFAMCGLRKRKRKKTTVCFQCAVDFVVVAVIKL